MAVITPPFFLQGGSHSAKVMRQLAAAIMGAPIQTFAGGISSTTGGGAHGVIANSLAVSEKSGTPNMSVDVAVGSALVTGTSSLAQGTYVFTNDAVTNLVIATSDASNPRYDLIVAQIRDNTEDSSGSDDARLYVVTGTPAASPADPTIPAGSLVLARVRVDASVTSIVNAKITDLRTHAAAAGGTKVCTSTTRPTGGALYLGSRIYETDTGRELLYDGSNWIIMAGAMPTVNLVRTTAKAVTTSTNTSTIFDASTTEIADTDAFHGASSGGVTIPAGLGGDYMVTATATWALNATGARRVSILVASNSSVTGEVSDVGDADTAAGAVIARQSVSKLIRLEAGATVNLEVWQNSGGNLNLDLMALTLHMVRHIPTLT